jgi:PAS domain S-box-containing protein
VPNKKVWNFDRGELRRIKRALKTFNECRCSLFSPADHSLLLRRICTIIVALGDYRFAWVGLADGPAERPPRPVAKAGYETGYLDEIILTWANNGCHRGPEESCLRSGQTWVYSNIKEDDCPSAWRDRALRRGYASALAVPLSREDRTLGFLSVFAGTVNAFGSPEVGLLTELAEDLAAGLIPTQSAGGPGEGRPAGSLFPVAHPEGAADDGIYLLDEQGLSYVNLAFENLTGYRASEVCGTGFSLTDIILPDDGATKGPGPQSTGGQAILFRRGFSLRTKGGDVRRVMNNAVLLPGPRRRILGIVRDAAAPPDRGEGRDLSRMRLQRSLYSLVQAVGRIAEIRDPFTSGHQRRVADLSLAIAREMGLPEDRQDGLYLASLIHDIGKMSVPAEILRKPGRLTAEEFRLVKKHPSLGRDLLSTIAFPWPVAQIIAQHHERLDGSGYPAGLSSDGILPEARILGLADVVEAMVSPRAYRPARGTEDALEEIVRNSGVLYDTLAVDACRRLFTENRFCFAQVPGAESRPA